MTRNYLLTAMCLLLLLSARAQSYNWKTLRIGGCGSVTSVKAHPLVQNLYFITTDVGNPYRWNNATQAWEGLLNMIPASSWNVGACANIAFDPNDATGNILYATVGKYRASWSTAGKLIKSTDRGSTWADCNLSLWVGSNEDQMSGERIAVDPANSNVVYVTSAQDGTYKSSNAGASWTKINSLNGSFVLVDVSGGVLSGVSRNIYIGTGTGVSRSTDGGATFTQMSGSPASTNRAAIHSNGTLYVTSSTAVSKWNGTAWSNISPLANKSYMGIEVNPANSNEVMVNEHWWGLNTSMYRSSNGGTAWTRISDNMTHDFTETPFEPANLFAASVFDYCWDPFNASRVFFTDWFHVFQTDDIWAGTVNWKARSVGHEEIVTTGVLACPPSGGNLLLSCTADVGGFDHASITDPPANSMNTYFPGINGTGAAFTETNSAFIARVGRKGWDGVAMGGYSTNGGTSYTSFASLPGAGGRIAVSASSETMLWATQSGNTYRSTNRGASWTSVASLPSGLIGGANVFTYTNPIVADKVNGNKFYAYKSGSAYVSTDGGVTFAVAASGLPSLGNTEFVKVETAPGSEGQVWLSLNGSGLYRSTNSGTSFTKIANVQVAKLMSVGKAASSTPAVYVFGTVNNVPDGVFRSDDNGATWTQIHVPAYRMGMEPNSMGADRTTYGRVYIGTNGNGIFVGEGGPPAPPVGVTGVSVSPASASVAAGSTTTLTATVSPANATNQAVSWTSGNTAAATVSAAGVVTGVAAGTATVTATTQDGSFTATCAVTVTTPTTPNIAPSGTAYRWSKNASATSNSNRVAAAGLNDGNTTTDVSLNNNVDDNANAYEGAGVVWASAKNNITRFEFVNGTFQANANGCFSGNIQLQTSNNGNTWSNVSGWTLTPTYAYNSSATSGTTYAFTGININNVKGIRVVGQVRLSTSDSRQASVREVRVLSATSGARLDSQGLGEASGLLLYPNPVPAGQAVTIVLPHPEKAHKVLVQNQLGQCIYTAAGTGAEIVIATDRFFAAGLYLVRIANGESVELRKLVLY